MHWARPNAANVTVTVANSTDTAANIAALNATLRRSAMPQSEPPMCRALLSPAVEWAIACCLSARHACGRVHRHAYGHGIGDASRCANTHTYRYAAWTCAPTSVGRIMP